MPTASFASWSCGAPAGKRLSPARISRSSGVSATARTASNTKSGSTASSTGSSGSRKPTIAQVQGVAVGGGCAIALTCDLRVATPESTFGIPIARTLGNCLSAASYSRLVDLMGPSRVKDLMFTGRLMDGAEAHHAGLIARLVSAETIDDVTRALALEIAANAPLTLRATKELLRRLAARRRLAPGDDADIVEMCYTSEDFREGVSAFLAKRKPQWRGR